MNIYFLLTKARCVLWLLSPHMITIYFTILWLWSSAHQTWIWSVVVAHTSRICLRRQRQEDHVLKGTLRKKKGIWATCWQGLMTVRHHLQALHTICLLVCLCVMCMYVYLSVCIYAQWVWSKKRSGGWERFLDTTAVGVVPLGGRWELNSCPLQEHEVLITADPSLQPQEIPLILNSRCTMDSPVTDLLMIKWTL